MTHHRTCCCVDCLTDIIPPSIFDDYKLVLDVNFTCVTPYYSVSMDFIDVDTGYCCENYDTCGSYNRECATFLNVDGEYFPAHYYPNAGALSDCETQPTGDLCGLMIAVDPNSSIITALPTADGVSVAAVFVDPCVCTPDCSTDVGYCTRRLGSFNATAAYPHAAQTVIAAELFQSTYHVCSTACAEGVCFLQLVVSVSGNNAMSIYGSSPPAWTNETCGMTAIYRSYTQGTYAQRMESTFRLVSVQTGVCPYTVYDGYLESDWLPGAQGIKCPQCADLEQGGYGALQSVAVSNCYSCLTQCAPPSGCGVVCNLSLVGLPDMFPWRNIPPTLTLSTI